VLCRFWMPSAMINDPALEIAHVVDGVDVVCSTDFLKSLIPVLILFACSTKSLSHVN
jgi:hypothetical protein